MQQLVRRQCQKECSDCRRDIAMGEFYYGNPNMTLCENCRTRRENEERAASAIEDLEDIEGIQKVKDYTGTCQFCGGKQVGEFMHIPTCANQECINKACEETV